jgi:hypothetical protein
LNFVSFEQASALIRGKSVAVVGSAPSVLDNEPGVIDGHEIVVRVNNYRVGEQAGKRCDVHYSFYGTSIRKTADELKHDGVKLCWCKLPNDKPINCDWHERNGKLHGIDFRYIYELRTNWWPCDVFIPTPHAFLEQFELLDRHIPTTGFSAILDMLACGPRSVFITGFDFFASGLHNVNEAWKPGDPADPIGHRPDLEAQWLNWNAERFPITFDAKLEELLRCAV